MAGFMTDSGAHLSLYLSFLSVPTDSASFPVGCNDSEVTWPLWHKHTMSAEGRVTHKNICMLNIILTCARWWISSTPMSLCSTRKEGRPPRRSVSEMQNRTPDTRSSRHGATRPHAPSWFSCCRAVWFHLCFLLQQTARSLPLRTGSLCERGVWTPPLISIPTGHKHSGISKLPKDWDCAPLLCE